MDSSHGESILRRGAALRTLDGQRVIRVFAAVLAVIAAFALFDALLVRTANRHRAETGVRLYERGLVAAKQGRTASALELFRSAYNRNPSNREYHLAFATALTAAGRTREGRAALETLLARQPAYGPANAEMARAVAQSGDWQRAAWYYHRALYGVWQDSPDLRALRFELADLLARHGAREQLVSEVVLLDAEPAEPAEARRLARLQLAAGEWDRAEKLYRSLLDAAPQDAELVAGLARAQMGSGRYMAAERGLRRAIHLGASDPAVGQDLELVTAVNGMDPTLRRLGAEEKHRRAHELASTLHAALASCSAHNPLLDDAARELSGHNRKRSYADLAESDLDTFEHLWAAREQICGSRVELPRPLELLAAQLSK